MVTKEQIEFATRQVNEVFNIPDSRPANLEDRIQRLEDHEQIRDAIGHYAICTEAHAWDDLFRIFTDDVERVLWASGHVVSGIDELRQVMCGPTIPVVGGVYTKPAEGSEENKHLMTISGIRVLDGRTEAKAACVYQIAVSKEENGQWERGLHEGRYLLTLRLENDRWKISKFEILSNIALNRQHQQVSREEEA
jgi:hypothetical protein